MLYLEGLADNYAYPKHTENDTKIHYFYNLYFIYPISPIQSTNHPLFATSRKSRYHDCICICTCRRCLLGNCLLLLRLLLPCVSTCSISGATRLACVSLPGIFLSSTSLPGTFLPGISLSSTLLRLSAGRALVCSRLRRRLTGFCRVLVLLNYRCLSAVCRIVKRSLFQDIAVFGHYAEGLPDSAFLALIHNLPQLLHTEFHIMEIGNGFP